MQHVQCATSSQSTVMSSRKKLKLDDTLDVLVERQSRHGPHFHQAQPSPRPRCPAKRRCHHGSSAGRAKRIGDEKLDEGDKDTLWAA
jgi:hypothetical protein